MMDTRAILERLKAEPGYEENAEWSRKILDASEARDADWLANFVDEQFGDPEEMLTTDELPRTSPSSIATSVLKAWRAVGALKRNRNRLPNR